MSKIELQLKETEKRFETLFLNSPIAIELFDSNGKLINANITCLELFGVSDISDVKGFDLFKDPNIPIRELRKLKNGNTIEYEVAFDFEKVKELKLYNTSKSGTIYLDVLITPIYFEESENINNYLVYIQDITKHRKSKEKSKASEEKYRGFVNNISDLIYELDINGKCSYVSHQLLSISGFSSEEMIGQNVFNFVHPDDLIKVAEEVKIAFNSDDIRYIEFRLRHKDGYYIPISSRFSSITIGEKQKLTGVIVDITERKKAEQKLIESEEKFRELVNHMSSGVAVYEAIRNGEDFIFKEFNLAGERIDNVKKEDLIGKSILEMFPGVKKFGIFNVFQRVWKTGKPEHFPLKLYKDDRIVGWRDNYVYKISSGEIVAIYDDVTEKMDALQKLRESEKNLRKLNVELKQKVEARMKELMESEQRYRKAYEQANFYKDLFAHDIKNILTVMNTSAELFSYYLNGTVNDKDIRTIAENLKKQVNRGVKLISNVQKLSELEEDSQSIQKIEITHFLKHAINYVKRAYQDKSINIKITPGKKISYVAANELLEDIFENVIINSVTYNDNSEVDIQIKISQVRRDDKSFIKMEFIDNGIGITDERKEMIFKRGNREYKGTKGMGLGLSLVKKIVEIYNGMIWVEDKVKGNYSKGSKFILLLPKVDS